MQGACWRGDCSSLDYRRGTGAGRGQGTRLRSPGGPSGLAALLGMVGGRGLCTGPEEPLNLPGALQNLHLWALELRGHQGREEKSQVRGPEVVGTPHSPWA